MKEYLEELSKKGMIEEIIEKDKKMIAITDQGNRFLSEFERIKEFSDSFGI